MSTELQPMSSTEQYSQLRQQIKTSLQKAQLQKKRLIQTERCFGIASLLLSAIATFITGESAIAGRPIVENWRFTTTLASVCTLGATVATSLHKQIIPTDILVETSECAAQLKALSIETTQTVYDIETVTDHYQRLVAEFSRVDV